MCKQQIAGRRAWRPSCKTRRRGNSGATGAGAVAAKFYCPLSKFAAFFKFHDCSTACRRTRFRQVETGLLAVRIKRRKLAPAQQD